MTKLAPRRKSILSTCVAIVAAQHTWPNYHTARVRTVTTIYEYAYVGNQHLRHIPGADPSRGKAVVDP